MKISYRAQGSGGYTVFGDDTAGDLIVGYRPTMSGTPQAEPLFRASAPFIAARGNRQWSVSWVISKQHASAAAAAAFAQSQAAAVPDLVDLKWEEGATVLYFTPCVFVGFEPSWTGQESQIVYSFLCGTLTTVAP